METWNPAERPNNDKKELSFNPCFGFRKYMGQIARERLQALSEPRRRLNCLEYGEKTIEDRFPV